MTTYRLVKFLNGHYYHIFNRGVERRTIFTANNEYVRFVKTCIYYRFYSLGIRFSHFLDLSQRLQYETIKNLDSRDWGVTIVCYCLMPNHFHFVLRQEKNNQISQFVSKISNSYSKYFNLKHRRVGPLFQGTFKAVLIESDEQLIHLSRYIHINPVTSGIISENRLNIYPWSSYREYISKKSQLSDPEQVLGLFKSVDDYKKFVTDYISYGIQLEKIKHLLQE